jgi:TonB family protein
MKGVFLFVVFGLISVCGHSQAVPVAGDSSKRIIVCGYPSDDEPQFNGPLGYFDYFKQHIKYPAEEKEKGIAGTVYISFLVDLNGTVKNVTELKGVPGGPGLTKEAIRVISGMPKWTPAKDLDGNPVAYTMRLPVRYVLTETTPVRDTVYIHSDTTVYNFAEVMPEFPGGNDSMRKFIQDNIGRNPVQRCCIGCKQGTVFISFIVETDGSITAIKAEKVVPGAPEFTSEALRVVGLFPKFSPATNNGKTVRCKYYVPVRFTVQ